MPCRVEKDATIEQSFEAELVMASFLTRPWYAHLKIMVRLSSPMAGDGVADDECRNIEVEVSPCPLGTGPTTALLQAVVMRANFQSCSCSLTASPAS